MREQVLRTIEQTVTIVTCDDCHNAICEMSDSETDVSHYVFEQLKIDNKKFYLSKDLCPECRNKLKDGIKRDIEPALISLGFAYVRYGDHFEGKELPTWKQIDHAKDIAKRLEIELPKEYTKQAYRKFIDEHKDEFIEAITALLYEIGG